MLEKLERFLIKFTVPALLKQEYFKKVLPNDYLRLKKIVEMNRRLTTRLSANSYELGFIRGHFLARLEEAIVEKDAIDFLPTAIRSLASIPTLKSLTINYLRKRLIKDYEKYKEQKELDSFWAEFKIPQELKQALENEFENKNEKIIVPFGRMLEEDAYDVVMSMINFIELEVNKQKLDTKQILKALKISLIGYTSVELYLNMLEDLTGCTDEFLDVMYWAVRRNCNQVYKKLLQIKPYFKPMDHVAFLMPVAVEFGNSEVYNALLDVSSEDVLRETTTLLHYAAQSGSIDKVNEFLKLNFDPMKRDQKEWLAIHHAIKDGDTEIYNLLLPLVIENLTEDDYFSLFYLAAKNSRLEAIEYLIKNGVKLREIDSRKKPLLELINADLNNRMNDEIVHWGAVFSSFDKLFKTIKFLEEKSSIPPGKIFFDQRAITIEYARKAAPENTQLNENVASLVSRPDIVANLSLYNQYVNGHKVKDSIVITFVILFSLTIAVILFLGILEKIDGISGTRAIDREHDHKGNVLLGTGGGLTLVDLFFLMCICLRKKNIPCTYFFRHNPPVAEATPPGPQVEHVMPLNNP